MLLHTILWLQWLMCVTVALNWLITLHILLIWHHLFSVSKHEKIHCPGATGLSLSVFQAVHEMSLVPPFQNPELLYNQCGFIWKKKMQLVSGQV